MDMAKNAMRFNNEVWNIDQASAMEAPNAGAVHARVTALIKLIESSQADAVVDFWNLSSCIAARVLKKPLITVIQSQLHPQSSGFIWWKNPPPDIPTAVPILNEVLNQYGLRSVKSAGDLFLGDLTLVVGIPELDPLPDTGNVIYLGPLLWQKPNAIAPKWFDELETDKTVVWVYTGRLRYAGSSRTAMDSEIVLHSCLEALKGGDFQVVLTTGYNNLPRSCLPLPANFRFEPFVPGLAMAERSDRIIHHGWYGSRQTGAFVGTPAVIIPTMSERESNARRLLEQGAAEVVLPASDSTGKMKRVDSRKLAASVKKALSAPSYKDSAERLRTKLMKYGGPGEAARLIEQALKKSPVSVLWPIVPVDRQFAAILAPRSPPVLMRMFMPPSVARRASGPALLLPFGWCQGLDYRRDAPASQWLADLHERASQRQSEISPDRHVPSGAAAPRLMSS
jgi:hypothetical protein